MSRITHGSAATARPSSVRSPNQLTDAEIRRVVAKGMGKALLQDQKFIDAVAAKVGLKLFAAHDPR
jgi:hypothetical protein